MAYRASYGYCRGCWQVYGSNRLFLLGKSCTSYAFHSESTPSIERSWCTPRLGRSILLYRLLLSVSIYGCRTYKAYSCLQLAWSVVVCALPVDRVEFLYWSSLYPSKKQQVLLDLCPLACMPWLVYLCKKHLVELFFRHMIRYLQWCESWVVFVYSYNIVNV